MSSVRHAMAIDPADNVAIVLEDVRAGEEVRLDDGRRLYARDDIRALHKIALEDVPRGCDVRKYGSAIGYATQDILAGHHVHIHNLDAEKMMR